LSGLEADLTQEQSLAGGGGMEDHSEVDKVEEKEYALFDCL
jgi:hypothetical protein